MQVLNLTRLPRASKISYFSDRLLAAQSCIALFAPTLLLVHAPTNFCLTPADAVVYAPYMIALGLLARTEASSWRAFSSTAAGISTLIMYSIWCDPVWTMNAAISWAMPFAVVTVSPLQSKTIMARGAALGSCLGVLVLSGVANYVYTMSQYTARVQFAETFDRVHEAQYVSAMSYSPNMKYFYEACALGQGELGEEIMRRLDLQGSHRPSGRPCV